MMQLAIGNKRFSSWSLRPWLLMKQFEIPFQEKLIPLDQPETTLNILHYSPSGKVPALIDGEITVWESLSIAEYLNEKFPDKKLWPQKTASRAWARSISNEMHAGFQNLRNHLPHDLHKKLNDFDSSAAKSDIDRIFKIWKECLNKTGGPFLFSEFSIADAMYAPVVNRFLSYGVDVDVDCEEYINTIRSLPAHQLWISDAVNEKLRMPKYESD